MLCGKDGGVVGGGEGGGGLIFNIIKEFFRYIFLCLIIFSPKLATMSRLAPMTPFNTGLVF